MLVFETDGTLDPDTLHVSVTSGDGKSEGSDAGGKREPGCRG
jgi:hypothetical protein